MIKFLTETGSVYELDEDNHKARRVQGVKEPTERTGKDGAWKEYAHAFLAGEEHKVLVIDWTGSGNATMTSRIKKIVYDDVLEAKFNFIETLED